MSQFPKAESQWRKVFHERPTGNSEESFFLGTFYSGRAYGPEAGLARSAMTFSSPPTTRAI